MATGLRRVGALAAGLAVVISACLTDQPLPTPEPTPSPEPEATAVVTRYPLDTSIWYAGLILTFGTATATIDAKGGPIAIDLTLENPGDVEATLDGPLRLVSGETALEPTRETVLPLIPAAGTASTSLVFEAGEAFDVAEAAIQVGRSIEHQALVPLVPGDQPAVTLEPHETRLEAFTQAGSLLVSVHVIELRSDLPDWGLQLSRTTMAMTLTYDVAFKGSFSGGFPFTTANLGLTLPDGTTIAARPDGHSAPAVVVGPNAVVTGLTSRFEVPAPGPGTYRLVVRDGSASKDLELVVEGP
jgi:hypothetical protein